MVNATPRPVNPPTPHFQERPSTHLIGSWVSPRASLDGCGKSRAPMEFDPWTFQPIASHYTNYTTPAHSRYNVLSLNPLNPELNPICYLLALLEAHHFLHVSRIRVKLLTFRLLMSYIYAAPILDVSRSHTTMQHSR